MADALLEQLATRENPNPSVLIDDRYCNLTTVDGQIMGGKSRAGLLYKDGHKYEEPLSLSLECAD